MKIGIMPVTLSARIPVHLLFHQRSEEEEKDFWRQLYCTRTPDILGLEQPCLENFHLLGDQWLLRHTPESWKFVVTAVMETMRRRSENSGFRIASSDEEQRQAYNAACSPPVDKINALQANKVPRAGAPGCTVSNES